MVINDISELRQQRMLVRHIDVFPAVAGEEEPWLDVEFGPLAAEHIARLRCWFPWLVVTLALMAAGAFAKCKLHDSLSGAELSLPIG